MEASLSLAWVVLLLLLLLLLVLVLVMMAALVVVVGMVRYTIIFGCRPFNSSDDVLLSRVWVESDRGIAPCTKLGIEGERVERSRGEAVFRLGERLCSASD